MAHPPPTQKNPARAIIYPLGKCEQKFWEKRHFEDNELEIVIEGIEGGERREVEDEFIGEDEDGGFFIFEEGEDVYRDEEEREEQAIERGA